MDNGEPENDYLKDMLKMREEFKKLTRVEKQYLEAMISIKIQIK